MKKVIGVKGFSPFISVDKIYEVTEEYINFYKVKNDNGQELKYNKVYFEDYVEAKEEVVEVEPIKDEYIGDGYEEQVDL